MFLIGIGILLLSVAATVVAFRLYRDRIGEATSTDWPKRHRARDWAVAAGCVCASAAAAVLGITDPDRANVGILIIAVALVAFLRFGSVSLSATHGRASAEDSEHGRSDRPRDGPPDE